MSEAGYIVTKNISALRKNYRNLLGVVTSTHSLIIEALPEMAGFCRIWRGYESDWTTQLCAFRR